MKFLMEMFGPYGYALAAFFGALLLIAVLVLAVVTA